MPKQRYRPKTKGEALDEICGIMTEEFIKKLKFVVDMEEEEGLGKEDSDEYKGKLDKVLSLCNLTRT